MIFCFLSRSNNSFGADVALPVYAEVDHAQPASAPYGTFHNPSSALLSSSFLCSLTHDGQFFPFVVAFNRFFALRALADTAAALGALYAFWEGGKPRLPQRTANA